MLRGVWGGVPGGPWGNLNLLLSFYTFLKELYSFYLRKRDQPVGKWGRRWEKLMTQQLKVQPVFARCYAGTRAQAHAQLL